MPREEKKEPFIYKDSSKGASHKKAFQITPVRGGEMREINIIHCIAKDSLTKCKGETKNTERVFVKRDKVDVICISVDDFNTLKEVKAWIIVTKEKRNGTKKKLWLRDIELLRENLYPVSANKVYLNAVEHGFVRGKHGVSDSIKCTSFMIHDEFKIWIEDEKSEDEKYNNPDLTHSNINNFFSYNEYDPRQLYYAVGNNETINEIPQYGTNIPFFVPYIEMPVIIMGLTITI